MDYEKKFGKIERKFETKCPRCGKTAIVTKHKKMFITRCNSCGFDMGNPRDEVEE